MCVTVCNCFFPLSDASRIPFVLKQPWRPAKGAAFNPKSSSNIYGAGPSVSLAIISMVTTFWLSKMSLRALLGKCDSKTSTANRELWADSKKEVPLSKSLIPWGCSPYILRLMRWGKPAFIFSWKSRRLAASNLSPNINHPSGPTGRIKLGIF